ncbi:MAG TPA: biotin--[acetyl-CoA-carboxylase] ligase [Chthoniobacterales bacterium]|jgi:BirA family biotin operon repressor/biotin-[acetyl-CoA-carboxylase] ligase
MSPADPIDRLVAEEIRAGLTGCRIGNRIVVLEETSSTNDLTWKAASENAAAGYVVFAEKQSAGRGQYGRRWESAAYKGLWFSVLLRPQMSLRESPGLTGLLAELIAVAIKEQIGCATSIKPPNDIYVAGKKVAGILVEGRTGSDGAYVAVAGIGVNVNQSLDDFPGELRASAGSLAMASGHPMARGKLAIALLQQLEKAM